MKIELTAHEAAELRRLVWRERRHYQDSAQKKLESGKPIAASYFRMRAQMLQTVYDKLETEDTDNAD